MQHVCIVGAGPSGFFAAQEILKRNSDVLIDIWEKQQKLFGHVRLGISTDHAQLRKNLVRRFSNFAQNNKDRVCVFDSYEVKNFDNLTMLYDKVILATGAFNEPRTEEQIIKQHDIKLENEEMKVRLLGSETFLGMLHGWEKINHEKLYDELKDKEKFLIAGGGNVSMDVLRFLCSERTYYDFTDLNTKACKGFQPKSVELVVRSSPMNLRATNSVVRQTFDRIFPRSLVTFFNNYNQKNKKSIDNKERIRQKKIEIISKFERVNENDSHTNKDRNIVLNFNSVISKIQGRRVHLKDSNNGADIKTVDDVDVIIWCTGPVKETLKQTNKNENIISIGWSRTNGIGNIADAKKSAIQGVEQLLSKSN